VKKTVSLTFYGGANEIGGNKILVEDKGTKIFLDFGQSFTLLDDFFVPEAFLTPRTRFGLRDYFALGLMPKLDGLYNEKALDGTDVKFKPPEFDAVFISHAHMDHVAHLEYLHPEIPVYMGECTKLILDSVQETVRGANFYGEESAIKTFKTGKTVKVGSMTIHPIHVDHSVPGAYGFIVETSEGAIAYTGDLRRHGPRADMTKDFIEKAKEYEPEALIIEGTRVALEEKRKNFSEETVCDGCKKVAKDTEGLILAMRYPKDLDRFRTFYGVAKEAGRELVISPKTAHLLQTLEGDGNLELPDPFMDGIKVYDRQLKREEKWMAPFLEDAVDSEYVRKNQKNILLELDFYYLAELVDIQPEKAACIHSMSEPFEEDPISQISDEVLTNWMERFKMARHQLHASGHAGKTEIFQIIEEIGAKKVYPVHTLHAGLFKNAQAFEKGTRVEI